MCFGVVYCLVITRNDRAVNCSSYSLDSSCMKMPSQELCWPESRLRCVNAQFLTSMHYYSQDTPGWDAQVTLVFRSHELRRDDAFKLDLGTATQRFRSSQLHLSRCSWFSLMLFTLFDRQGVLGESGAMTAAAAAQAVGAELDRARRISSKALRQEVELKELR